MGRSLPLKPFAPTQLYPSPYEGKEMGVWESKNFIYCNLAKHAEK
jgi:hypothetical protein